MNKGRTLASPAWIGAGEEAKGRSRTRQLARSADEQVTTYFREHAEPVYRYLAGAFGSEEDAEEVTQEAFLRLYEALSAGERIENPRGWVVIVARRLMINTVKHDQNADLKLRELAHAADQVMCGPARTQEEALLDRTRLATLRVAVRSLPFTERECLYARAEGLTLQEIGALLGLDLRRVSEILARAIKKLQQQVDV